MTIRVPITDDRVVRQGPRMFRLFDR
jgi:hypothetical protein